MADSQPPPVGLLAGWGRFPFAFARKARQVGLPVVCVGLRSEASPELKELVHRFYWSQPLRISRIIRCFRREGVCRMVMAGKVHKARYLYNPWRILSCLIDWRLYRIVYSKTRGDNRDDTLLTYLIREFQSEGIEVASALDLCPELLIKPGVLTRRAPTRVEEVDIRFGWAIAKQMGGLDIGQSVSVKDRSVLAVEAVEGTDQSILRAGELCRAGKFTVIKVAKPAQDMRFDVPTIGTLTIETMRKAGARVLAIEAEKTILLDEEETLAMADRYGISIVALSAPSP